ncbi:hypothetical protein M2352_001574 [Azospirillum fermentarium]|uniref:FkbM family methyltransferase n=1 Tax=Azospirillum fermentarium TaxID=1233114 RepID=UPI002226255A|nr:FkbM family methyltransferase [Azospirillum fermentarium]MCW2245983.1 hypothetical protein [Azospirillum fermentarium]
MNAVARLVYEYGNLFRVLSAGMILRLAAASLRCAGPVLRSRRLTAVDAAMSRNCHITYHGSRIALPLGDIDRLMAVPDDNPTFGNLREMFANDVYLRPFRPGLRADVVVDLGSNRGLFLVIAVKVLKARLAVGVEPEVGYDKVFPLLCAANAIAPETVRRIVAAIAPVTEPGKTSMTDVLRSLDGARINFLKCDIEGAEYPLFAAGADWLGRVDNLAMEVHPDWGDNRDLLNHLRAAGFVCLATDRFGRPSQDPAAAEFIYASSVGDLGGEASLRGRRD